LPGLIDDIAAGRARAEPQPGEGVTYAAKIDKAEGRLDWRRSAAELDRQLRALDPWPGCWTEVGGERLNVLAGEPAEEGSGRGAEPGLVLDDRLLVACGGGGALRLTRLQRPGRRPQGAEAFLRGFPLPAGTRLGLPPPPCPATS
ncbi:MAG TPA: methionyl-tRNA formyltransferase, partial [Geminicoccaceae bacterium]|nr:methionyl-tRNA formyltransferase [Geminicoccaceae bacterium]